MVQLSGLVTAGISAGVTSKAQSSRKFPGSPCSVSWTNSNESCGGIAHSRSHRDPLPGDRIEAIGK